MQEAAVGNPFQNSECSKRQLSPSFMIFFMMYFFALKEYLNMEGNKQTLTQKPETNWNWPDY